ncbi:hypothetical protein BH24BAC1_BH24BAC1_02030 [soil metagenome]
MKKLPMFFLAAGLLAFTGCDSGTGTTSDSERVIGRDTVVTEMEVRERVIDIDTTERTETIDVDRDNRGTGTGTGTGTQRR